MAHKKSRDGQEDQFDDVYEPDFEIDDPEEIDSKRTKKDSGISRHRARGKDKHSNDDD